MATTTRVLDANVNGIVYTSNANDALEALDTCHSGATAPTDEVANGKLWLDTSTTPGVLKIYNNATWVAVVNSTTVDDAGGLLASNNLSDVANAATALSNLGLIATATELNYVDGVTSSIQTQLDAKSTAAATEILTNKTLTAPVINGVVSGDSLATQSEAEAGTNNDQLMTPLRTKQAIDTVSSATKVFAWVNFNSSGTIQDSLGVSSVSKTGTGRYTVTWSVAQPDDNYYANVQCGGQSGSYELVPSTTGAAILVQNSNGTSKNPPVAMVMAMRTI